MIRKGKGDGRSFLFGYAQGQDDKAKKEFRTTSLQSGAEGYELGVEVERGDEL